MTTAADDAAVEDAFEAYLAGRPVSGAAADTFPGLAAFSESVRATATQPGRPNAALAELLATGLLTDQSSPSTRTARTAGSPPARRSARVRIRRRTAMIFPVLLAKFLSAGAVAQAATGAGVAVVLVTGAGAAGVLPDPVQDTVAGVVETVSPLELPDSGDTEDGTTTEEPVVEEPVVEEPVVDEPVDGEVPTEDVVLDPATWVATGPAEGQSFGEWVSLSAHNPELREWLRAEGHTFGSMVSHWAHKKGLDDQELAEEGVDLDDLTEVPTTEPTEDETEVDAGTQAADDEVATDKKSSGKAHGSGNGKGAGHGSGSGKGNGRN
jgi:hypothetical protein